MPLCGILIEALYVFQNINLKLSGSLKVPSEHDLTALNRTITTTVRQRYH